MVQHCLGRGPQVEEQELHAVQGTDGHGVSLLNFLKLKAFQVGSWEEFEETYDSQTRTRYSGYVKLHTHIKLFLLRRRMIDVGESLPWLRQVPQC